MAEAVTREGSIAASAGPHRALAKFATDRLPRGTYGISDRPTMDFGADAILRGKRDARETEIIRSSLTPQHASKRSQRAGRAKETRNRRNIA